MTTALEDRLSALAHHIDAELSIDVDPGSVHVASNDVRRDRRRMVAAAAAAVIVLGVGAVTTLIVGRDGSSPAASPDVSATSPWRPAGVEYPLTETPVEAIPNFPSTSPAAWDAHRLSVGDPTADPILVASFISYDNQQHPDAQRCIGTDKGIGTCASLDSLGWAVSMTGSNPGDGLWVWFDVPPDAAFVHYQDGDVDLWQRPVSGTVLFPNVDGFDETVTTYSAVGDTVQTITGEEFWGAGPSITDPDAALYANISNAQSETLRALTAQTVADCVTAAGGDITNGIVNARDTTTLFETCFEQADQAISASLADLGVTYIDPHTQTPTSPDSPYATGG